MCIVFGDHVSLCRLHAFEGGKARGTTLLWSLDTGGEARMHELDTDEMDET